MVILVKNQVTDPIRLKKPPKDIYIKIMPRYIIVNSRKLKIKKKLKIKLKVARGKEIKKLPLTSHQKLQRTEDIEEYLKTAKRKK